MRHIFEGSYKKLFLSETSYISILTFTNDSFTLIFITVDFKRKKDYSRMDELSVRSVFDRRAKGKDFVSVGRLAMIYGIETTMDV